MIEEIKEEIQNIKINDYITIYGFQNIVMDILDKHNQDKIILDTNGTYTSPKPFKELKKELGSKYDKFMYDMNLGLLKELYQYKNAWEELKTNEMAVDKISLDIMQELEDKYNIGEDK